MPFQVTHFKLRLKQAVLAASVALYLIPSSSFATDTLDISTGLKTLLMMSDRASGTVPVAVVYDAANAGSKTDAENIKNSMDHGVGVPGGLSVNAYLVSSDEPEKLSGAKVAFLARDINASHVDAVCAAAGKNGMLTISTNIDCVKANKCILGIVSSPRVQIYYSREAAETAHITFPPIFTMLAKPI